MAPHTTLRIGGPADAFALPRTREALASLVAGARDAGLPVSVIGGGANLLVADRGVRGLVVSTAALAAVREEGGRSLYAEAGAPVVELCRAALAASLSGLEFAAGLPGSLGGAVYMNARCYGAEFADVLTRVDYFLPASGALGSVGIERESWSYKRTPFMPGGSLEGAVVLGASLALAEGDESDIAAIMAEREADRGAKGHFDYPSAGSLFKNDRAFGRPTGALLDELGFRGRRRGDAMVSPKHANIFVNAGRATAADMLALIAEAQAAALAAFGFELEPEVVLLGEF